MDREQEQKVLQKVKEIMTSVRNDAVVAGMRSALAVVYDMCQKDNKTDDVKLKEIKEFCEKGMKKNDKLV